MLQPPTPTRVGFQSLASPSLPERPGGPAGPWRLPRPRGDPLRMPTWLSSGLPGWHLICTLTPHRMIFWGVEGGYCPPLGCLPSPSPAQTQGRLPFQEGQWGGSTDYREGPAEGREDPGPGAPGCTGTPAPVWKQSWLGSRFSSKAEANAPKPQPYPLTEDGKVAV